MFTRRQFLKRGISYLGAGALMPSVFGKALAALAEQSGRDAADGRVLVIVQMAGGNDGLNTIIPVTDGRYFDSRPQLGISPAQAIALNPTTGLHPSLAGMKELWDRGVLAVVEGVGHPSPNFSHFVSMRIWQKADPTEKTPQGWLGRYLEKSQETREAPFLGLAIGRTLPAALETAAVAIPSVQDLASYRFLGNPPGASGDSPRMKYLASLYEAATTTNPYGPLLNASLKAAMASVDSLQKAHQDYEPAVQYPANPLASALRIVAGAIAAYPGVKVYHVTIGGFDTHANQATVQARQLKALSDSLFAFYSDLKAHNLESKVVVMTWSEFGRRVKENGSQGTDHGSAGPLFILGTPVKGGLYGDRPGLENLDNGNLRFSVDFRSVYASVLDGWLRAPSRDILGATYQTIPLWR